MNELKIEAKAENMAHVLAFVDECLEKLKEAFDMGKCLR